MIIVYIAYGIVSGMVAASTALWVGAGLFSAFVAYIIAGIVGMTAGLVLVAAPKQIRPLKQPLTQRG